MQPWPNKQKKLFFFAFFDAGVRLRRLQEGGFDRRIWEKFKKEINMDIF